MSETPSLSLPLLAAEQAQKHVTHNEALGLLDAIVQLSVKDRDLASPPGSPADGDRYIVAAGATGAWAGEEGSIAVRQDGAWSFCAPREGWRTWVEDEDALLVFDGSGWVDVATALDALQNLTLLGVGTTADATNPFSAKLNKALWTAKTAGEGGDGDLRYTMNKETAGDVLSLLLQSGFSGRAEIGLIGDDDLTVKVSPDGSAWTSALIIDKDDGAALFTCGSATARLASDGWVFALPGGGFSFMTVRGESSAGFVAERYQTGGGGPVNRFNKYRGTIAAPSAVASNDTLGQFTFFGHDGAALRQGAAMVVSTIAATPSSTDMQSRFVLQLSAAGSVVPTEIMRADHASGLSAFGANPFLDQNRHFRLRSYTIATLPAASTAAGQMIYCSDLGGGGGLVVSDGTSWRRACEEGAATVASDAAFTLTPLSSAPDQLHTGTLTANRAVTLSTTNAYSGARFRISRTGGGAFTLDVGTGPLKALATNTWGEFVYDGAAWRLGAYGAL